MAEIKDGVCCGYCKKSNTKLCPVKSADPWSRWKNYCNEFESEVANFKPNDVIQNERIKLLASALVDKFIDHTDEDFDSCLHCYGEPVLSMKDFKHESTCIVLTAQNILKEIK